MSREIQFDRSILFTSPGGAALVSFLAPGVLLLTGAGGYQPTAAEGPMPDMDQEIARAGKLVLFLNMLDRERLSGGSREMWLPWLKRHHGKIETHVLVRSKLLDMAMTVMAIVGGGVTLKSYSSPDEFVKAIARVVPGFTRLPVVPAKSRASSVATR